MKPLLAFAMLLLSMAGCSREPDDAGFAGLAETGQGEATVPFLQPGPGDRLSFPEDLGPHPQHRIEWWYLTANVETDGGEPLGLQWTQFRQALMPRPSTQDPPPPSRWPLQSAWMAHGAVSWAGQHWFAEKLARGDIGHAGATASPFEVWLDDWQLTREDDQVWRLQVPAAQWSYDLTLRLDGEPVAHGEQGFSAKSASGEGSMYFSLVDIAIEGTVTIDGRVLSVRGRGWFDREWSSQLLKTGQQGWDWFALHLDSGDKLMAFRLREEDGEFVSGTWIPADGKPVALAADDLVLTPDNLRGDTPTRWRLQVPDYRVDLDVAAPPGDYRNRGQYPYWESPVSVTGSHSGDGYMELTGYGGE
ncbi:lipocalin-like domain-containing protein [Marinobacter arenosus]|uniref:lipocalin-like domain-containing protein n=1 Tax=Marinobacter arenosus TaxID=2856822 RepID=UPI001C4CF78C|nr:lipocalin-like domain-containing protein [Marinobacter arenosus]MBW0148400.1 carotenoid 1,2-hydratase [Marinobacter arenosus]